MTSDLTARTRRPYRTDTPSYRSAHTRVQSARGRASEYVCQVCGERQAAEWAYDHSDPDELTGLAAGGVIVPYSLDPGRYFPACLPCHRRLDAPERTHCKRGHEFTPENTYRSPDGERWCRACVALREQRRRKGPRPPVTQCKHGHEYTEENTYRLPGTGSRVCRTCQRERRRAERKAA